MMNTGTLKLTAQGDREIAMTRVFDAPRRLVFGALTKPELVIHFPTDKPLPAALVKKLVKARVAQNENKKQR